MNESSTLLLLHDKDSCVALILNGNNIDNSKTKNIIDKNIYPRYPQYKNKIKEKDNAITIDGISNSSDIEGIIREIELGLPNGTPVLNIDVNNLKGINHIDKNKTKTK